MTKPRSRTTKKLPLRFREWVPPYIRDVARVIYKDVNTSKDQDLLRRLISDPRMERVWNELLKKKRQNYKRTEQYVHSVRQDRDWSLRVRLLQDRATELRNKGDNHQANRIELRALVRGLEDYETFLIECQLVNCHFMTVA